MSGIAQVFFKAEERSCVAAVSRVIVLLVSLGRKACSDNTSAYCRARAKLPESAIRRIVYQVADRSERAVPDEWHWKRKRDILLFCLTRTTARAQGGEKGGEKGTFSILFGTQAALSASAGGTGHLKKARIERKGGLDESGSTRVADRAKPLIAGATEYQRPRSVKGHATRKKRRPWKRQSVFLFL